MAIYSARSTQKPGKLVTYGKGVARAYDGKSVDSFFDNDDDDAALSSRPARANEGSRSTMKDSFVVEKPEHYNHLTKQVKSRALKRDAFDVPSSDEELEAPVKRVPAPPTRARSTLIDDTHKLSNLASWEMAKVEAMRNRPAARSRVRRLEANDPANQLQIELAQEVARLPSILPVPSNNTEKHIASDIEPQPISAAARLAARKQQGSGDRDLHAALTSQSSTIVAKRTAPNTSAAASSPRKRGRTYIEERSIGQDALSRMKSVLNSDKEVVALSTDHDVLDLPETADTRMEEADVPEDHQRPSAGKARSSDLTCKRLAPAKGVSAPARLHTMLLEESESIASTVQPPFDPSNDSNRPGAVTPQEKSDCSSPQSTSKECDRLTPKQKRAWDRILPGEQQETISPSALSTRELRIGDQRRNQVHGAKTTGTLALSKSDITEIPRKRRKLVDHLKAAAFDSSSEDDSKTDDSDVNLEMADEGPTEISSMQQMSKARVRATEQLPQGVSQSSNTGIGPRVTYARVRSYLPEDSFEEAMALDCPTSTIQARLTSSRTSSNSVVSKRPAAESKSSDDETGPARLRSIHELRAAGKTQGFMQDTEALMDDISNHDSSARGARRSAFLDITAKMMDKPYVERFIAHGFEQRLAAEFVAPPDEVGDLLLAVITSLLLFGEPPRHTLKCLYDAGGVSWLLHQVSNNVDVRKMARDRRNNMAKATQNDLLARIDTYQRHAGIWEYAQPSTLTTRLAAMKSLELFIRRSRTLGDQSELLMAEHIPSISSNIHPDIGNVPVLDTSLSISILEALAISSLPLAWPESVSKYLATIIPNLPSLPKMPRHTTFLALRLTLNLTNDNAHNCVAFAQSSIIHFLLRQIGEGFNQLGSNPISDDSDHGLNFDLLILSLGIMTNLADQNALVRDLTIEPINAPTLTVLLATFASGHERAAEAESMEETNSNVAFGYLAVLLANLCQAPPTRQFIAASLPGKTLQRLVAAVEEFVAFHEKVDLLQSMQVFGDDDNYDEEESGGGGKLGLKKKEKAAATGGEVWGAYTARFKAVLDKLKAVA